MGDLSLFDICFWRNFDLPSVAGTVCFQETAMVISMADMRRIADRQLWAEERTRCAGGRVARVKPGADEVAKLEAWR